MTKRFRNPNRRKTTSTRRTRDGDQTPSRTRQRTTRQPRRQDPRLDLSAIFRAEIVGIVFLAVAVLTFLSFLSPNQGQLISSWLHMLRQGFGWGAYLTPVLFALLGVGLLMRSFGRLPPIGWEKVIGVLTLLITFLGLTHLMTPATEPWTLVVEGRAGGLVGWALGQGMSYALGRVGAYVIMIALLIIGMVMVWSKSPAEIGIMVWHWWEQIRARLMTWTQQARQSAPQSTSQPRYIINSRSARKPALVEPEPIKAHEVLAREKTAVAEPVKEQPQPQAEPTAPIPALPRMGGQASASMKWQLPKISEILEDLSEQEISQAEIEKRVAIIERSLNSFGAPGRVVEVNQGPVITQFGVEPLFVDGRSGAYTVKPGDTLTKIAAENDTTVERLIELNKSQYPSLVTSSGDIEEGWRLKYNRQIKVKVSKISSLADDLSLALAAAPIRIEAPVPGRAIVGIEVPNQEVALVSLRGVMEAEAFGKMAKKTPLPIALGEDVSGEPVVADLVAMPHLLIAGATGTGKSVCINAIIATFLSTNTPDMLQMIMVDPKRVELTGYNGIPHLLTPVVVDLEQVVGVLQWVTKEMDRRYKLFAKVGARNITDFNRRVITKEQGKLPYIVVVVDELADLMMVAPDDAERLICRIAQMARATGIHMVIATQRPSVDVVTGLIKANFPARISFMVTSSVDSRVIIDTVGAERLLGSGDMLFMSPSSSQVMRLQGCFVSDGELSRLIGYWKSAAAEVGDKSAVREPLVQGTLPLQMLNESVGEPLPGQEDEMIEKAVEIIRQEGRASTTLLQRHLRIGYARAARIIEVLEEQGLVGPDMGGSKGREVLSS